MFLFNFSYVKKCTQFPLPFGYFHEIECRAAFAIPKTSNQFLIEMPQIFIVVFMRFFKDSAIHILDFERKCFALSGRTLLSVFQPDFYIVLYLMFSKFLIWDKHLSQF